MCVFDINQQKPKNLDVQLRSSPVSSLGVVSDGVVGLQSDPLRQRSVLLGSLAQFLLSLEALVSLVVSTNSDLVTSGKLEPKRNFGNKSEWIVLMLWEFS
uniref:Uncharacterized protein n=1 Tax=Candidozyma auris TaxID=498019 RepID=A0A0L0P0J1_CANAR